MAFQVISSFDALLFKVASSLCRSHVPHSPGQTCHGKCDALMKVSGDKRGEARRYVPTCQNVYRVASVTAREARFPL